MQDKDNNIIYGVHAVLAALKDSPTLIEKVYIREGLANKDMPIVYNTCKSNRIPISIIPTDHKMTDIAGPVNHQGLIAIMRDFNYMDIADMLNTIQVNRNNNKKNLIVIMDEIEDPHNVGAIIRTAVAVGATGIIVPKHRQAPISGAVYKASTGLVTSIPITRISNIGTAIEKLKANNVWVAALNMSSLDTKSKSLWETDMSGDIAIIVGNEGKGVGKHNASNSDLIMYIPMDSKVESLNASVSAAICMYEWKRQNG